MKPFLLNKIVKFNLSLFLVMLAGAGLVLAQETGSLDSLASGFIGQQAREQNIAVKDSLDLSLNAMLELEMHKDFPLSQNYNTLDGLGLKRRQAGLAALWRQNNADFLAKAAADRSGEGLIPDIKVPLPGIGKILGSGAQIKISGSEKITIGGQQTDNYGREKTTENAGNTGSFALKIKQEQQVNLEGIIGERLHVLIDWNSEALTDKKSKIRLYYEGKEDEILQRLEAGDTEFSLAGSSLIGGLSTQHKGLFGIKGVARLGGLELTAIASKDEGQGETKSFVGQSQQKENKYNDKDFIAHRFFWIPLADPADSIVDLRVYVQSDNQSTISAKPVYGLNRSWLDFSGTDSVSNPQDLNVIEKKVIEEYGYERIIGGYLLSLEYGLSSNDVLTVAYKTKHDKYYPDSTVFKGFSKPNLAIIKPSLCRPSNDTVPDLLHGYAWNYEFRNFYNIGSSNIVESSLSIKVKKRTDGLEADFLERDSVSEKLFTELMDLSDANGVIHFQNLRMSKGYFYFTLIFDMMNRPLPTRPFDNYNLPVQNPDIYDKTEQELANVTPQYQIVVGYLTKEAVYPLEVPGQLIEGSVQVTIGGETVPTNQYTVDYETGTVTFAEAYREKVIQAGTNLNISYQFMPWASFGTKTLAGLRGIYKFNEQAQLGATWLYRSEQSLETKPRLGEEPKTMIVAGLDGFYKASPGFLTTLANYLPGVETEAASSFEISGEAAANFPNPNTRGEVYLDDMDGTKLTDGLNLYRQGWVHSSIPDTSFHRTREQLAAKTFWYNPTAKVTQGEINPAITDSTLRKDPVTTIKIHHQPDTTAGANSWSGITQLLSKSGMDLSQSKLLNVWVRTNSDVKLHIDFGREISMDQVRRDYWGNIKGRPDTVDAESLAAGDQQIYTDANDRGLDMIKLSDDNPYQASGDDGNDNFVSTDSSRCNGTEGNGIYDTEDLKLSSKKPGDESRQSDSYYTFSFDLSGSSGDPNLSGWRKFSVPLDSARAVGYPYGWGIIYYARVWVDSCSAASAEVELALVEVSGNRWQEKPITAALYSNPVDSSEKFHVTVKNNKDDADYLPPPNAVENDENGHPKFEQSLVLSLTNLKPGHLALAQRSTNTRENNYTGYKKLKLWVNGRYGAGQYLIRLASTADSTSPYYQYTGSLTTGWQELSLNLEDLTSAKALDTNSLGLKTNGAYTVKGTPNLANIGALYLGVANPDTLNSYSGEVWFDNLRLDEVRRDRGTAVIANVRLGVADLLSLSLGYNRTDAYWYTMGQSPALAQRVSYNLGGSLQLDKFYLDRLGLKVPVIFGASLAESYPWYGGDDRKLTDQESSEQMDWTRGRNVSFSLSKNPSQWWLTDFTIDRMSGSLNWSRSTSSNRTSADSTTTLNTGINWGWASGARKSLGIGNWLKLYYLPSNISFAVGNNRTWHWNLDKLVNAVSTAGSGLTRGGSAQLAWQIADPLNYRLSTSRNLLQRTGAGDLAWRYGLGAEVSRAQTVDYHTTLTWLKIIQPTFNYSTTYNQANRAYLVPGNPDSSLFLDVSNANNLSLNGNLEIAKWLIKITALRNEAKDDSTEVGTPLWLVIQLEKILKKVNPLDITFSQSKNNSSSGLYSRTDVFYPDIFYQMGWRRRPLSSESYAPLASERAGITNSYSASTGGSLGQLSINAGWQRNDSWTWDPTSAISSQGITWPDLRASLNSVERIFKGLKILTSASLTSNYSKREDKSSQSGRGVTRWNINHSFSPMISLNTRWKKQVSTQASFDYSTTDSRLPVTDAVFPSGWQKAYTRNLKVSASGSYSFSAPQGFVLNMWKMGKKRFKFKSDLNLGLQTSYSNTVSAPKLDLNEPISKDKYDSDKTDISISPNATYNFTRNIKGELSGSYTSSTNKIIKTSDSRSYSLNTTVTITF